MLNAQNYAGIVGRSLLSGGKMYGDDHTCSSEIQEYRKTSHEVLL